MARFPIINGGNACVKGFLEKAAGMQPGESFGESSREKATGRLVFWGKLCYSFK